MFGGVSKSQGRVAEDFFYHSPASNPVSGGARHDIIQKNVSRKKGETETERDILLLNDGEVSVIDTKYRVRKKDLIDMTNKKMPKFRTLFPEFNQYHHHWGLATCSVSDALKKEFLSKGIAVIQRKGDITETDIPEYPLPPRDSARNAKIV